MARSLAVKVGGAPTFPLALIDPATGNVQPVGQTGYTLAMSEEFGGSVQLLDSTLGYVKFRGDGPTWATWYPDWPRFNAQSPGGNHTNTNQGAYFATSKVGCSSGNLVLACDQQTTVSGLTYTAGMIQSLQSFTPTYGYMEARLKIATSGLGGHWPAWWASASAYNAWPPEIDIWEYFGNSGNQYLNNVYLSNSTYEGTANTTQDAWHVYGCKWTSTAVTFYLDGVQTNTTAVTPTSGQYLILNNGVYAPHGPTFASNDMTVDYVRVWQ